MNITVTIQAIELSEAIKALAAAIAGKKETDFKKIVNQGVAHLTNAANVVPFQTSTPETVAPVQAVQAVQAVQETPAAVPTAPIQATVQPTYQPVEQQPVQVAPVQTQTVPTTAPTYTMEQLAVAATQIMDAGRRNDLVQLLASFGIQALTALPKEQYGVFATKLREMGAKI